jgi:hypothetical protein
MYMNYTLPLTCNSPQFIVYQSLLIVRYIYAEIYLRYIATYKTGYYRCEISFDKLTTINPQKGTDQLRGQVDYLH